LSTLTINRPLLYDEIPREHLELANRITTGPGNTTPNQYRMCLWLIEQELINPISPYNMQQVRAFLNIDSADPAVMAAIRSILVNIT
jgi:hypothetical protein